MNLILLYNHIVMNYCLYISAPFACFTRPEMKVERVSYDIITPSAVRAIFESVCWKPAIRWVPQQIEVLNPVSWINLRRNEVAKVAASPSRALMAGGSGDIGFFVEENRQQRAGCFLRDVAYRIHARFEMTDKAGKDDNPAKFAEMFTRRAEKGQCFNQPYMGCREFSVDELRLVTDINAEKEPIKVSDDLGYMLYDIDYENGNMPMMFRAIMQKGRVDIPAPDSEEIKR